MIVLVAIVVAVVLVVIVIIVIVIVSPPITVVVLIVVVVVVILIVAVVVVAISTLAYMSMFYSQKACYRHRKCFASGPVMPVMGAGNAGYPKSRGGEQSVVVLA
jgi:hypothetical protein